MPNKNALDVPQELLILGAAVKSGIIEALQLKPMSSEELARELKADGRSIWTVCEALAALGYLSPGEGKYQLSPEAVNMLYNPEAPDYTGFTFMHRYNIINAWVQLPQVIASGKPAQVERGADNTKYFMLAMSSVAGMSAPAIAEFCLGDQGQGIKILDIGGGPLTYAKAFASRRAKVTVLDLPNVVNHMSSQAAAQDGIEMVPGDFNEGLPPGPFDMAFLGNICHIFGEPENRELFKKVAGVLSPGGRIAIVDMIRGTNPMASLFAVNMLVNTKNGGTWTLEQYSLWLGDAGFSDITLQSVGGRQLLLAGVSP